MATIGTSTSTNQFPPYIEKAIQDYLTQAQGLAAQPYVPYGGQRVAPLAPQHQQAIDAITKRATEGAPDINAARALTTDITGGKYLDNPYLGAGTPFGQAGATAGEFMSGKYLSNPFINPEYTNRVIADNAGNMARAFATGTAAQNDAAANRAGAYGGSGWANKQSADAEALARATAQMAHEYQLAQQTLGAGDYRSGTGQIMQGAQLGGQLGQVGAGDYRSGIGNMLTAGQLAGNLSQQDWTAAQMLAGAGDISREPQQQQADIDYQEFLRKQQWPYQQTNFLGGAIGNAAGGQGTTTTTQTQPGSSNWLNGIGLGLVGVGGLLDYFNKP